MMKSAITLALNHEQIKKDLQRITKIKPIIYKYNWKEIDFPSNKQDWKSLNQITNQLLLIFYMLHTILKK